MVKFLRSFPLTLLCIVVVWYICLIKPPSLQMPTFDGIDKVVHVSMYLGTCGVFWFEYFHHRVHFSRGVLVSGAVVLPILMSGAIELAQAYLTTCRSGDWWDFAANSLGVLLALGLAVVYRARRK